ncbi:hypothetical protein PVAND_015805 [Polypedilum vanderplanki]|uniref:Uncharacterized protein n=1 Tax=Polypedilum vanderplanki TaxID=319348 RepID=A0A9J6BDA9_POLVA|nr:hypothetical protein PVAND_015805 [Polypedilum vanderplanki]
MKFFIALASLLIISSASALRPFTGRSSGYPQDFDNEFHKGSFNEDHLSYSHGFTLECDYAVLRHYWGEMYTCLARNLVTRHHYDYIVNATGDHLEGKTDRDVKAIFILGQRTPFIPYNITSPFGGSVVALRVENSGLRYVNRTLNYEGKLEFIHLENNLIEEVPAWALRGMTELKWLSLRNNRIRYLEGTLLRGMTKLIRFSVSNNLIEVVPSGLFHDNVALQEILFYNNKIRMIGWKLVSTIPNLKIAAFLGNPCTKVSIYDGVNIVDRLTTEFRSKCSVDCRKAEAAIKMQKENFKFELMNTKTCVEMSKHLQDRRNYIDQINMRKVDTDYGSSE